MQNRLISGALSSVLLALPGCASSAIEQLDDAATTGYEPAGAITPDNGDAGPVLPNAMDSGSPRDSGHPLGASDAGDAGDGRIVDAGPHLDAAASDAGHPSELPSKDAALAPVDAQPVDAQPATPPVDAGAPAGEVAKPIAKVPEGCTVQTYQSHSYLFCTDATTWVAGRAGCLTAGLDLAIIDDAAESAFVAGNGESWIGETDIDHEGTYLGVWLGDAQRTDGHSLPFLNWASGEPNNAKSCSGVIVGASCIGKLGPDEDCIIVLTNGYFNDAACDTKKRFVCEQY